MAADIFGRRGKDDGSDRKIPWPDYPKREERIDASNRGVYKPSLILEDVPEPHQAAFVSANECYSMNNDKHGIALIINNKLFYAYNKEKKEWEYQEEKERKSTMIDEHNLRETLKFLGYQVEIRRNQTSKEMTDIFDNLDDLLKQFKGSEGQNGPDSFICCILTHGNETELEGSDCKPVGRNYIEDKTGYIEILKEKPKIFIIQACRGRGLPKTINNTAADPILPLRTPVKGDMCVLNSTVSGDQSYHYTYGKGSFFIMELCGVFCEYAMSMDLNRLEMKVNDRVSKKHVHKHEVKDEKGIVKETSYHVVVPSNTHQLRKLVHFFVGYTQI